MYFTRSGIFLNNSETVKVFCSIQQHFISDIGVKFGIPNFPQSLDIGENSDRGISDFRISGQSLQNENCHNPRISHDIDMKFKPVTKLDKEKRVTVKKTSECRKCRKTVTSLFFFRFIVVNNRAF